MYLSSAERETVIIEACTPFNLIVEWHRTAHGVHQAPVSSSEQHPALDIKHLQHRPVPDVIQDQKSPGDRKKVIPFIEGLPLEQIEAESQKQK